MVLTIKHKIGYYKSLRNDIWGFRKLCIREGSIEKHIKYKRVFKIFFKWREERIKWYLEQNQRYIYRIDVFPTTVVRKFLKKRLVSLRVVRLFYLTLTYKHFNKMARLAKKKDGLFANHFLLALEGRILSFLYRTGFVSSMFDAIFYVKNKFCMLDRKYISFPNNPSSLYKFLTFHPCIKKKIYVDLIIRLSRYKKSLFNPPRYIFVSYWFLFAYMLKFPRYRKLVKPSRIFDFYRITGFVR
jgi:hypothetical protein